MTTINRRTFHTLAATALLAGATDGSSIYQGSPNELILTPMALQAARYRAEDWRLVQMIGSFPLAVLARKGLPANTIDELVALARKAHAAGKPLSYASVGVGSLYHLLGAHFANTIGRSVHDFAFNTWTGYFVPRSTPEPVVRALNQALSVAIGDPEVKAQIEKLGGTVPPMMTLEAAAKEYESQTARFRAIARSVKLEPL